MDSFNGGEVLGSAHPVCCLSILSLTQGYQTDDIVQIRIEPCLTSNGTAITETSCSATEKKAEAKAEVRSPSFKMFKSDLLGEDVSLLNASSGEWVLTLKSIIGKLFNKVP